MKIVLDTNVLIAAFIARGVCSDLLEHCARQHTLVTSEFILTGDADLLILKCLRGIDIVRPADLCVRGGYRHSDNVSG